MAIKILGTSNDRDTCDCCGRRSLKKTVVLAFAEEERYYGVDCAARALGRGRKAVESAAQTAQDYQDRTRYVLQGAESLGGGLLKDRETRQTIYWEKAEDADAEASRRNGRIGEAFWTVRAIRPW